MNWIKWLCDSLAVRTVLLVVAVVAIAEVATFSLVFQHGKTTHVSRTARYVSGQIRLLQTVLPGLDATAREQLESTDPGEQWLRLRPDSAAVPPNAPAFDFAEDLAADLEHLLGQDIELRHAGLVPGAACGLAFTQPVSAGG